jgi:hypothetical protein
MRAFVRLEPNRIRPGMRWWEAKTLIVRDAVRSYLAAHCFTLGATALLLVYSNLQMANPSLVMMHTLPQQTA